MKEGHREGQMKEGTGEGKMKEGTGEGKMKEGTREGTKEGLFMRVPPWSHLVLMPGFLRPWMSGMWGLNSSICFLISLATSRQPGMSLQSGVTRNFIQEYPQSHSLALLAIVHVPEVFGALVDSPIAL